MDYQHLIDTAVTLGCIVTENTPMSAHTTFKIGGPADLLIDLPGADAAAQVLRLCKQEGIPHLLIGNGSNLLVGDKGIRGAVLRLMEEEPVLQPELGEGILYAPAGMQLKKLCQFVRDHHLTGLEFAFGIPGTVGGAVYMNAGAYGGEMADVVQLAHCITPEGEMGFLPVSELKFGYRHSVLMEMGYIVTGVTLKLTPGDYDTIAATMKDLLGRRREKQPLEYPSAGSFFKRPVGYYAGALVEQTGLKGFRVGDAQVSEKHAGFVVNLGGATSADVQELLKQVSDKVFDRTGIRLEPEVRIW